MHYNKPLIPKNATLKVIEGRMSEATEVVKVVHVYEIWKALFIDF